MLPAFLLRWRLYVTKTSFYIQVMYQCRNTTFTWLWRYDS